MTMIAASEEYNVAQHYLPYIINGDASGLDFDEIVEVESFLDDIQKVYPGTDMVFDVSASGDFDYCKVSGLMAMTSVLTVNYMAS